MQLRPRSTRLQRHPRSWLALLALVVAISPGCGQVAIDTSASAGDAAFGLPDSSDGGTGHADAAADGSETDAGATDAGGGPDAAADATTDAAADPDAPDATTTDPDSADDGAADGAGDADKGMPLPAVTVDMDGQPRGSPPDIGADEL